MTSHAIHAIPAERITAGLRDLEIGAPGAQGGSAPAVKSATSLSLSIHWSVQRVRSTLLLPSAGESAEEAARYACEAFVAIG